METKPPISLNLAFLIITSVSLLLSGIFIYQNWRLNQKLQQLIEAQKVAVPTPTSILTGSPTQTCRPRPACLDSYPACKIVETPDMCHKAAQ